VVILSVEPQMGCFVFYAGEKGKNNVGVWLYSEDFFRGIYKYNTENDSAERFLRKFVRQLANEQVKYLAG
jgi:hypothetical protein